MAKRTNGQGAQAPEMKNTMKKLMIAAAFAAMVGGASADGVCDNTGSDCWVYDVKVTMKTLGPKLIKGKDCYGGASGSVEYLVNTTRKFQGIAWACEGACEMPTQEGLNFVMWEPARKVNVTEPLKWGAEIKIGDIIGSSNVVTTVNGVEVTNAVPVYATATDVKKAGWEADTLSFDIADRYDKKANKVEACWSFEDLKNTFTTPDGDFDGEGEIIAAGFGKFDVKNSRIASISGNAVGTISPTMKCDVPVVCDLCTEFEDWFTDGQAATEVVMSGSWSMKFNKSLATGKKTLGQVVPKYAQD